jgi:hypothetical protein
MRMEKYDQPLILKLYILLSHFLKKIQLPRHLTDEYFSKAAGELMDTSN